MTGGPSNDARLLRIAASSIVDDSDDLYRSGTGFFITRTGDMLTSGHVVRGCRRIEVWPPGAASGMAAEIESSDDRLDVALLTTHYSVNSIARFASGPVPKGRSVMTIGYGFTASAPLEPVVTRGRIDGSMRSKGHDPVVLRARLYEGNSGGPVVDDHGRLVGMVVGRYASDADLGVAIRGTELVRFVRTARRAPDMATDPLYKEDPEGTLNRISALIQCITRQ